MERILGHTGTGGERGRIMNPKSFANSLSATDYKDPQKTIKHLTRCEIVAMPLREEKRREEKRRVRVIAQMEGYEVANRVYDRQGLAPTICTCQGGNRQPKIIRYVKRISDDNSAERP